MPDKSIAALVRYYYSWKKTRARSSLMDRQVRRMVTQRTGEDSNTVDSAEAVVSAIASDSDEDKNEAVSFHKTKLGLYTFSINKKINF